MQANPTITKKWTDWQPLDLSLTLFILWLQRAIGFMWRCSHSRVNTVVADGLATILAPGHLQQSWWRSLVGVYQECASSWFIIHRNLYKSTIELCVAFHKRKNWHDIVNTVPIKLRNLCALVRLSQAHETGFTAYFVPVWRKNARVTSLETSPMLSYLQYDSII